MPLYWLGSRSRGHGQPRAPATPTFHFLSVTRRPCIICREFFITAEEGSSTLQWSPPLPYDSTTPTTVHMHTRWRQGRRWVTTNARDTRVAQSKCASTECAMWRVDRVASTKVRSTRCVHTPWTLASPRGISPTSSGSAPAPDGRPIRDRAASRSSPPAHPPFGLRVRPQREDKR